MISYKFLLIIKDWLFLIFLLLALAISLLSSSKTLFLFLYQIFLKAKSEMELLLYYFHCSFFKFFELLNPLYVLCYWHLWFIYAEISLQYFYKANSLVLCLLHQVCHWQYCSLKVCLPSFLQPMIQIYLKIKYSSLA